MCVEVTRFAALSRGTWAMKEGKTRQELFGRRTLREDKLKGPLSTVGNSTQTFLFYFLRVEKWR